MGWLWLHLVINLQSRHTKPTLLRSGTLQVTRGGVEGRDWSEENLISFHPPSWVTLHVCRTHAHHPTSFSLLSCSTSFLFLLFQFKPTGDPFLARGCVWVLPGDFIFHMPRVRRQLGAEQLEYEQSRLIRFPAAFSLYPPPCPCAAPSCPWLDFILLVVFVNLQISLRTIPSSTLIKGFSAGTDNVRNN